MSGDDGLAVGGRVTKVTVYPGYMASRLNLCIGDSPPTCFYSIGKNKLKKAHSHNRILESGKKGVG